MLVDGKEIADEIKSQLAGRSRALGRRLVLAVVEVGSDPVTEKFVERKKKFGEAVGVEVVSHQFPQGVTEEVLAAEVRTIGADPSTSGIIVQLPLPLEINTDMVIACIPPEKDVDALGSAPRVLAPVAGAVAEIFSRSGIHLRGKRAVVIGHGRLVGKPVADWLTREGAVVDIVSFETREQMRFLSKRADIVVSGAGVPRLVTPELLKEGVVLVDAGTSESEGKLVGDIDPRCMEKAALYTPVPGGVGPITVAVLFRNLLELASG